MNPYKLRNMAQTLPDDLVGEIMLDKSGFPQALNNESLYSKFEVFQDIMLIILKAIDFDAKPRESIILLSKVKSSSLLSGGFSSYYSKLLGRREPFSSDATRASFGGSINLLKIIAEKFPTSTEKVLPPYSMAKLIISQDKDFDGEIKKDFEHLEVIIESSMKQHSEVDRHKSKQDYPPPPDNFRDLGIFPNFSRDLACLEEPYLRPIEIEGGFQDVEHYLDVHFRLLREDFIQPLRIGIREYLKISENRLTVKKLTEVRIYKDVKIIKAVCTNSGLSHEISFSVEKLKQVNWQTSKRFIYGSLICLSNNNFEDIIMATVEDRKPDFLAKGILRIKFEEDSQLHNYNGTETFVMLETTAFFEPYRHVLDGLITINPETFPFQGAIVQCHPLSNPPKYLNNLGAKFYDLRCLSTKQTSNEIVISDEPEPIAPRRLKLVNILRESSWPSAEWLGLDESQSTALRNSLTSEVSVVQGPPGTGKTFLGLKIVKILLENWERWNADEKPILVVCYTNHALDQFLEGISKFLTKAIVRVGGRSKSELMKSFSLNQLRMKLRSNKNIPKDIYSKKKDVLHEMRSLQEEIERAGNMLEGLEKNLIHENLLRKFMTPEQFTSLTSFQSPFYSNISFMMEWLHMNEVIEEHVDEKMDGSQSPEEEEQEYVDIKNEADLEEQQRRLEDDLIFGLHNLTLEERRMNHVRAAEIKFNVNKQKLGGENEWQMQKDQIRNMKKNLKKHLSNNDIMDQHEGEAVINVWQLNIHNRWRLYRYWLQKYRIHLKLGVATEMQTYNLLAENLKEIQSNEDEWVMKGAKIIGMTTTGAARYRNLLSSLRPKVIIVEEAAEVLESHVITSLNPECQHLILIGDHKQLRPSANVYKLGTKYHLNCSLFERLVMNDFPYVTLERQHRMRPDIADFARIIYPTLKDDVSVLNQDHVMGVNSDVFLLNHCEQETQDSELMSASNKHEAAFLAKFCLYLIQQGYSKQQITILTPYAGQMFEIRKLMPKKIFEGLRICPVDNYQGEENDIILLSLVRSNFNENIGFLKETNRLNVALTRAKKGLFVIGNFDMLRNKSEFVHGIYSVAVQKEPPIIGNHITLCCQNHPNVKIEVSRAQDFDLAPEGGCTLPCRFRLSCGHTCTRSCHPYDKDHSLFLCLKPCQKVFPSCQHNCPRKCSEKCGKCELKVKKVIPRCKHEQEMMCYQAPERFVCRAKCDYVLPCNHPCTKPCGEEHAQVCYVRLPKVLDCGHQVKIPCYRFNADDIECDTKCRQLLKCGHFCEGTCGKCFRGRVHVRCSKKCDRTLICGHGCRSLCSDVCPPCRLPCENKCSHNDCKKECGQPCDPCNEDCSWNCRHRACTQLCHMECDRSPCDAPCEKRLRCRHPCVGLCGEICPSLCRICQAGELTEIFFGTEQDEDARFIQLMDCPHVIEVGALDNWVSEIVESPSVVPLCCPKCRTPIQTSNRYRRQIKSIQSKIEKVKEKICGNKNDLESKKIKILATLKDMGSSASSVTDVVASNIGSCQMTIIEGAVELLHHLNDFESDSYAQKLKLRIMQNIRLLSMQECEELQFEISRLELLKMFEGCRQNVENSIYNPKFTESHRKSFEQALRDLKTCKLDNDKENAFRDLFRQMKSLLTGLGITEKERIQIITAMGDIQRGAWFECPNGHVYAIGDCGGATQESRCNECGATIGGTSHALRRDNRWNRAMDGAERTAWPGTAMNPGGP